MPRTRSEESRTRQSKGVSKGTYRLTCARCRARKVKCDGSTPECRICLAYGQPCYYDKTPPMSQVVAMAQRIEHLERNLASSESNEVPVSIVQDHVSSQAHAPVVQTVAQLDDIGLAFNEQQSIPTFQSTSAVQEPTVREDIVTSTAEANDLDVPTMDEDQISVWEVRACEVCSEQLRLPIQKVKHLLKTYFTWVFPAFMFVSRPQFLQDTATGGRYSSPLLCSVLCLQATRFTDHVLGDELSSHVRFLLGHEITRGPSITLVQALLQLSARELGHGSLHQAWLYSGMAFRLATDMGIMTRTTGHNTSAVDIYVRGQLAWSCYLWDKAMSLYLGRTPSLLECPNFEPPIIDGCIEEEEWMPYFGSCERGNNMDDNEKAWSSVQTYGASCFANFCKLGPIINDILVTIYAKKPSKDVFPFVQRTRDRLNAWRSCSPPHLIILTSSRICPPPHILSQR